MEDTIQLEVRRPDRPPRMFDVVPGVYTVGNDPDCRIRLPHESVDSRHAILTIQETGAWIEDLGSSEGTILDLSLIHI